MQINLLNTHGGIRNSPPSPGGKHILVLPSNIPSCSGGWNGIRFSPAVRTRKPIIFTPLLSFRHKQHITVSSRQPQKEEKYYSWQHVGTLRSLKQRVEREGVWGIGTVRLSQNKPDSAFMLVGDSREKTPCVFKKQVIFKKRYENLG